MKTYYSKLENKTNLSSHKDRPPRRSSAIIKKYGRTLLLSGLMGLAISTSSCSDSKDDLSNILSNYFDGRFFRDPIPDLHIHSQPKSPSIGSENSTQLAPKILSLTNADVQDSWTYSMEQPIPARNFAFDCWMRIDIPTTNDYPIQEGEAYAIYENQEKLGGYESALVARKSGTSDRYRVMFSTKWQEILLWSSEGGILAVKPYNLEVGRTYRVLFVKQGPKITIGINHAAVLTIFDRTAPMNVDTLGVATKEGDTYFGPLRVWEVGPPESTPDHQPNFSLKTWKGIPWGFDGHEPIFAIPGKNAFATEVKLVPGYKAQLDIPWYMQQWVDEPFRTDKISTMNVQAQGTQLIFTLTTKDDIWRRDLTNNTKITVSYVSATKAYQYDHESELIIPPGATLNVNYAIDVTDVLYNQIVPSASTHGQQWPITHDWSVYQQLDGNLYKEPINHFAWYPGYGTPQWWNALMNYMKPDNGSWVVMGDRIANPLLQWRESPTRKEFSALMCWWGYDLHWNWFPGDGSPTTLSAGNYKINWRLTSISSADANAQFASSNFAFPGDLTSQWLVYTGGVGNLEKFDKTVLRASPFGEFIWGDSSFQDSAVGRGDGKSLRFDGPKFVQTTAGGSQFTEDFEAGTDYEISAWVKTENVAGEGPGFVFSGNPYYPGISGTHDWQQIGFVARPSDPLHTVEFSIHNSGSGRVWVDDFLIRPITAGNPVTPALNNLPKPLTSVGSPSTSKLLELLTANAVSDPAKTILDSSGHGNHAVRQNVSVITVAGHDLFHFPGADSQILMRGHDSVYIPAPTSLIMWFKPGTGQNGWNTLASGGPAQYDRWRILLVKTDEYYFNAQIANLLIADNLNPVPENQWSQMIITQKDDQVSVYLNGQLVGSRPFIPPVFESGNNGYIRLGAMSYGGIPDALYEGDVSQVKILSKALNGAEVSTEFTKGPFAP